MNTTTLAAALIGFLLGGLTVSVAAELTDHPATASVSHSSPVVIDHREAPRLDRV